MEPPSRDEVREILAVTGEPDHLRDWPGVARYILVEDAAEAWRRLLDAIAMAQTEHDLAMIATIAAEPLLQLNWPLLRADVFTAAAHDRKVREVLGGVLLDDLPADDEEKLRALGRG